MKQTAKKTKKNLDGFMEGGLFHPIRHSDGYDPQLAGDKDDVFDKQIRKDRNVKKSEKNYQRQIEREVERDVYGDGTKTGRTLAQFVRASGGIRISRNKRGKAINAGELSGLTFKESRKRGLVADKPGKGDTLDGMFQAAREAGFDVRDENELLDLLDDEVRKGKATYATHGYLDYRDNPRSASDPRQPAFGFAGKDNLPAIKIDEQDLKTKAKYKNLQLEGREDNDTYYRDPLTGKRYMTRDNPAKAKNMLTTTKKTTKRAMPARKTKGNPKINKSELRRDLANVDRHFAAYEKARKSKTRGDSDHARREYEVLKNQIELKYNASLSTLRAALIPAKPARATRRNPTTEQGATAARVAGELIKTFDVDGNGKVSQRDINLIKKESDGAAGIVLSKTTDGELVVQWNDGKISLENPNKLVFENGVKSWIARRKAVRAYKKSLKADERARKAKSAHTAAERKAKANPQPKAKSKPKTTAKKTAAKKKTKSNSFISTIASLAVGADAALSVKDRLTSQNKTANQTRKRTPRTSAKKKSSQSSRTAKVLDTSTKKNPFDAFEEFNGRKSTKTLQLPVPSIAPDKLWSPGKMVALHVAGIGKIDFSKEATGRNFYMCADENKQNLWIAGAKIGIPDKSIPEGEWVDLGKILSISYWAKKEHLDDTEFYKYKHRFGDEGGEKPVFALDRDGFGIIHDGDYVITAAGIRD